MRSAVERMRIENEQSAPLRIAGIKLNSTKLFEEENNIKNTTRSNGKIEKKLI
jgi:hypothetical protein